VALETLYVFVISITGRSKRKVSDKDIEIFLKAQNNFVSRAGPEINIHYLCMANSFSINWIMGVENYGKSLKEP